MRHISIKKLKEIAQKSGFLKYWEEKEEMHLKNLMACKTHDERSEYMKAHTDWNEWQKLMFDFNFGKCWYSESPANSNHWSIEHFRPKNRAKIGEKKKDILVDGYWWLAYNVDNFLLAGSIINIRRQDIFSEEDEVLGKGNLFPLKLDVCQPCKPFGNRDAEVCYLLNPTKFQDTQMITYDEDGEPIPTYPAGTFEHEKAAKSIPILGLNHKHLNTERRKKWKACTDLIMEGERLHAYPHDPVKQAQLESVYNQIQSMVEPEETYTSVVKACIMVHYKVKNQVWLEALIKSL